MSDKDYNIRTVVFDKLVEDTIKQILENADALDCGDFQHVDYINQLFPNEQSLSNIDDVIAKMECEMSLLDDNIRSVVRSQSATDHDGRTALEEAHKVINQLFSQISEIKLGAEKTENMIKEITRDIKQLDCAKNNLTLAITTLNHLHMLAGGIENLTNLIEKKLYSEILNPLQAIIEVNQQFKQHEDIAQIKGFADKVEKIHQQLATQITKDFQTIFTSNSQSEKVSLEQLTDACKVVSVLDPKVRTDILKWFLKFQLQEYEQLFHENQDIAWLDKIDKRYVWLKRHLLDFEDKFGHVFPPEWEVSERIAVKFCIITHNELSKIMKKRRNDIDVKLLLYAVYKTQNFEQLLTKRFTGVTLKTEEFSENDLILLNKKNNALPNQSFKFADLISPCFEPYFDIYIESVDRNLSELIERFTEEQKKPAAGNEPRVTVLQSCADLFVFYKKCIMQCTQLNNGKTMYDMAMLFKKYLREYANKVLESSIPKFSTTHTAIGSSMSLLTKDLQNLSTAAGQVIHNFLKEGETPRFSVAELSKACCILTTAEYCLETVQQLEDKLNEKMEGTYAETIDLSEEKDVFHRIISNCLQILVQDLENGCEPALNAMCKIQWHLISNVGDQSAFVNSIILNFKETVPTIRENLSTSRKYYTQFCHKFVNSFIPKYISALLKCRLANSVEVSSILGCEQLLLDTHSLKITLLDLPSISSSVNRKAPTSYTKAVIRGMTRAEMIIKVVMKPVTPIMTFYEQVVKLLPDVTLTEYQKILEMKGVKKVDQLQLIEIFKKSQISSASSNNPMGDGKNTSSGDKPSGSNENKGPEVSSERGKIKKLEDLLKKRFPN